MLYHLTKERLEEPDVPMPADFPPLADFQWAAVKSTLRLLRLRNGVFISDVVGLGKTFIAAALLKWLKVRERQRALIICPPQLEEMWRWYKGTFGLAADILSLGKVLSELPHLPPYRLVLIDESHNLRNREGRRYRAIPAAAMENRQFAKQN